MDALMLPLTRIPPADEALRAGIREFVESALAGVPADVRARSWMGYDPAFSRALAERGWVGLALPPEHGGGGRGVFARFVLVEELLSRGAPVLMHWIADRQSGPMIARFGSEAQKRFYLPRICRAEIGFCIGLSEPNAGSDLASVRTRAERTADGWRLNGRKIWTTNAHRANYMIALVRTSGSAADRHAGLSQVIVDLSAPGVSVRPIRDLTGDTHFNEVAFDDVRLPDDALIGDEGQGWAQANAELAFERSGPERLLSSQVLVDEWFGWLRTLADPPAAQVAALGAIFARLVTLRAMSLAVAARIDAGESPMLAAALVKDLGTLVEQDIPATLSDMLADLPDADRAPPPAVLMRTLAYVSQMAPTFSLRGGTREILRGVIARGLSLR
ncbi:acyl-CoA dehydrogenase family protein [Burkholderiaceae bacterium FT117]|uniref:acyl-CoA dehydrogenase family protein n=1 Tax=Zeimonas sediminis TaxID=2944268 RepID=UPI002342C9A0|nr:acyl-CoA dehydrogenase family protein [Zeimonas sediminis]MCM5571392.1 acyl-CoA dehydrogenase family protein [Zeimonas sediminis]